MRIASLIAAALTLAVALPAQANSLASSLARFGRGAGGVQTFSSPGELIRLGAGGHTLQITPHVTARCITGQPLGRLEHDLMQVSQAVRVMQGRFGQAPVVSGVPSTGEIVDRRLAEAVHDAAAKIPRVSLEEAAQNGFVPGAALEIKIRIPSERLDVQLYADVVRVTPDGVTIRWVSWQGTYGDVKMPAPPTQASGHLSLDTKRHLDSKPWPSGQNLEATLPGLADAEKQLVDAAKATGFRNVTFSRPADLEVKQVATDPM